MAKSTRKTVDTNSSDDIFQTLLSQHNNKSSGIATLGIDMSSEIKYYIDSGSLLLNLILSNKPDGGWPGGRIVEVYGPESIGKSTLAYVAMAKCQQENGIVIYCDIERTGNKKFMSLFGIDLNKIITTNEETIETLFQSLEDNLNTLYSRGYTKTANLIVVDSVTSLQTDAELEGGYEYNMNVAMGKAKMMGKALKKIIPFLSKTNTCLYLVNQVRENTSGYGEKWVVPGGKSIPFYASIRLSLQGKEKIVGRDKEAENQFQIALADWKALPKDQRDKVEKPVREKTSDVTLGYTVTAFTKKNKIAPPERTAEFDIEFAVGVSDERNYFKICEQYGWLKKSGAYYEFTEPTMAKLVGKKFYKTEWLDILEEFDGLLGYLKDKIKAKMVIKIGVDTKFSNDELDSEDSYQISNESIDVGKQNEEY